MVQLFDITPIIIIVTGATVRVIIHHSAARLHGRSKNGFHVIRIVESREDTAGFNALHLAELS
jgi:hypothetical protein